MLNFFQKYSDYRLRKFCIKQICKNLGDRENPEIRAYGMLYFIKKGEVLSNRQQQELELGLVQKIQGL